MVATLDIGAVLTAADFRGFQDIAYRHAGIRLGDGKLSLVQNRIQRRLRATGSSDYRRYLDLLASPAGRDELQHCIESLTTNETYFFRHKEHWDFFIANILGGWNSSRMLRVWSAAASTGEEAHSTAIACLQHAPDIKVTIEATDINASVLEHAKRGIYGEYAVQKFTSYARQRWLTQHPSGWEVVPEARRLITWKTHNLLSAASGPAQDVVFLRNVLIYFDEASKATALRQVAARMNPGAWLFLGGSEALGETELAFTPVRSQIYRKA